jgi:manganese efflux pump family protein
LNLYSFLIIAVALSLDAFGVALCLGLDRFITFKNRVAFIVSFTFFQFLFTLVGAKLGYTFISYIADLPELTGGILLVIIGIMMIREGIGNEKSIIFSKGMYIILGISVSIDALVVGFTVLNEVVKIKELLYYSFLVGLITMLNTTIAFYISRLLKNIDILSKYASFIGGIILILFGINMMFT